MMPLRVLRAFTNIAGPYFTLPPQVVLKPRTVGRAVGMQTPILPVHAYMA